MPRLRFRGSRGRGALGGRFGELTPLLARYKGFYRFEEEAQLVYLETAHRRLYKRSVRTHYDECAALAANNLFDLVQARAPHTGLTNIEKLGAGEGKQPVGALEFRDDLVLGKLS